MSKNLIKKANIAYREDKFSEALELYKKASEIFGGELFQLNIDLCQKKIQIAQIIKLAPNTKESTLTLLDPISELCWKNQFHGFPLSIFNYKEQIATSKSKFAFFESAWRANNGAWEYAFTSPELKHKNAQALLEAIDLLKKRKIPLLFWNKEDPMHFDMFLPIAKKADYVFTTDELSVANYQKELGHKRIKAIPFGAPVEITNPENRFKFQQESICFAGTYYAKNHEDRKKQMDAILPSVLEFNGSIYDRASSVGGDRYSYPEIYHQYIRPAVDFSEMVDIYKKFKIFLNVNTITKSPTMMSRRVYELLASGTPVISTPSKSITEQFPGIILTATSAKEASIAVDKLLSDNLFWCAKSQLGIREVLSKHTYSQRWSSIIDFINKNNFAANTVAPSFALIIEVDSLDILFEQVRIIISGNLKPKKIIFHSKYKEFEEIKKSKSFLMVVNNLINCDLLFMRSIPENLGDLPIKNCIDYVVFFGKNCIYMGNYIPDLLIPFQYSSAKAVAKPSPIRPSDLDSNYLNNKVGDIKALWHSKTKSAEIGSLVIKIENISDFKYSEKLCKVFSKDLSDCIYISDFFNILDVGNFVKSENIWKSIYEYKSKISL